MKFNGAPTPIPKINLDLAANAKMREFAETGDTLHLTIEDARKINLSFDVMQRVVGVTQEDLDQATQRDILNAAENYKIDQKLAEKYSIDEKSLKTLELNQAFNKLFNSIPRSSAADSLLESMKTLGFHVK
jgi:ABC-type thiamine transport system substrate-binding protein